MPIRFITRSPAIIFLVGASAIAQTCGNPAVHLESLFMTYVEDGLVDYERIGTYPDALDAVLTDIAATDYEDLDPDEQKAFLINAYNVLVIKSVVNNPSIQTPFDAEGFFDKVKHSVAERLVTLDQLEKGWLYKDFPDARLHFAVVCAAIGCPTLPSKPFKADNLDKFLDSRVRPAMNDPKHVRVAPDGSLHVSQLFEWYEEDFLREADSIPAWINQYRDVPVPEDAELHYIPYDWSLNAQKPVGSDS